MINLITIVLNPMEDTFFVWAWIHMPTITSCLIFLWLGWKGRQRLEKYRHRFLKVEIDNNQLNSAQSKVDERLTLIDTRLTRVDTRLYGFDHKLNGFDLKLNLVDSKLSTLITHLSSKRKIDADLFRARSPIALTETGTLILEEMGGKAIIDAHLENLIKQMESHTFKSALDVQNYCTVLLSEKIEEDEFVPVRDYVFTTPIYEMSEATSIPLDVTVAITIMGIYLRDKYFDRHPELNARLSKR